MTVLVHAGRRHGAAFEHQVLAKLCDGLQPKDAPSTYDVSELSARISRRIASWNVEDDMPQLIMGLLGPDACEDWPTDPSFSVVCEIGPSARILVSITGTRDDAEQWAKRLAFRPEDVTFIPADGFRLHELDESLRARLAWAALDGPGPRAYVEEILASLRAGSGSHLEALLSTLAHAFAPLGSSDAAQLLGVEEAEVTAWFDTHGAALDRLIEPCEGDTFRFRHEALRAAWKATAAERTASVQSRFAAAAREVVLAHVGGNTQTTPCADTYLRRYAGAHLLESGAPDAELLELCDPRWALPRSREDLRARRAELEQIRWRLAAPLEDLGASSVTPDALPPLVRVELSRGALTTIHRGWDEGGAQAEAAWSDIERALAVALFSLAAHASPSLRANLEARALDVVRRTGAAWRGDGWEDALALVSAARAASEHEAATFARWAVAATWRAERGPDIYLRVWLTAANLLPPSEAEALVQQAIERALSSAKPGGALAQLATADGLGEDQALALFRAAMSLPPTSRANALAPLLRVLPDEERVRAVSPSFDAFFVEYDENAERHDTDACTAALLPYLGLTELSKLLDGALPTPGALAVRFAELGAPGRTLDVIKQRCGGGIFAAHPLLLAAATKGGRSLVRAAREAVTSLDPAWVATKLVRDHAPEAIQVLGLDAAVDVAERGGGSSEYTRVTALVALCHAAPEPSRPALAARAVAAYRDDRDTDGLESVVRCAPWMSLADAAWLFAVSLGDAADQLTLVSTLSRWGGVAQLAPIIARIGGNDALAAVADVLPEALRWTERADAG
ncbi:uncharacterized protein SOCEGT47_018740 [Sorangium cellulosum]|uniref:Uncharacterized protein n=2 Tax=Sorangium cellulosum TaxID=56 RepID=A0A4V0ND45_SORCE|nr:uncharacterized protein SOCEGT47_018740 [Sorangium cellulosum]